LFEPFVSSESRSSGLGLYICRELCERHGGAVSYRRAASGDGGSVREGNEFFVSFRPASGPVADNASFDKIAA
jgi:two-component system, NtrC family, sensor histidine kinase PilS